MSLRTKVILVSAAVMVIMAATITTTYLVMQARNERDVAQARSDAAQKLIDVAEANMAKRDSEFASAHKALESRLTKITTPAQVAQAVQLPANQGGLIFNPFKVVDASTPDAPGATSIVVPQENIVPLYKSLAHCEEREKALTHCEADKTDLTTQRDLFKEKATDWEKAAKHGSKMRRFLSFAIPVACASGTAYAMVTAKQSGTVTGLSTLGAGVGCKLAIP